MASTHYTFSYGSLTAGAGLIVRAPRRSLNFMGEALSENWSLTVLLVSDTMANLNILVETYAAGLRLHDQNLSITRDGVTIVNTASRAGYNTRASVRKVGGPNDLEVSQELEVTFDYQLPVTQTSTDAYSTSYLGRKAVSISTGFDNVRRRTVTIACVYTETPSPAKSAKENFDALHETWVLAIAAKASGQGNVSDPNNAVAGTLELVDERVSDMNRLDREVRVVTVLREVLYNDASSADDPVLVETRWSFSRRWGDRFGKSTLGYGPTAADAPIRGTASLQCGVRFDEVNGSAQRWKLAEAFSSKIRSLLLSRTRDQLELKEADYTAIVGPLNFQPSPSVRQLSVSVDITFVRGGGAVLTGPGADPALWIEFEEDITIVEDGQNQYRKILDGGQDTYGRWSPGRKVTASVQTTMLTYKAEAPEPPKLAPPWRFDRRRKSVKVHYAHMEGDTRTGTGNDGTFRAAFMHVIYQTIYSTEYTLVVDDGAGHSVAGPRSGAAFVPGESSSNDSFQMTA